MLMFRFKRRFASMVSVILVLCVILSGAAFAGGDESYGGSAPHAITAGEESSFNTAFSGAYARYGVVVDGNNLYIHGRRVHLSGTIWSNNSRSITVNNSWVSRSQTVMPAFNTGGIYIHRVSGFGRHNGHIFQTPVMGAISYGNVVFVEVSNIRMIYTRAEYVNSMFVGGYSSEIEHRREFMPADVVTMVVDLNTGRVVDFRNLNALYRIYGHSYSGTVIPERSPNLTLSLSHSEWDVGVAGGSADITVSTNQPSWNVTIPGNAGWLTAGSSGSTLTLNAAANMTAFARVAEVTVTAATLTRTVTVIQETSALPALTKDGAAWGPHTVLAMNIGPGAGTRTFTIGTNQATWSAYSSEPWMTASRSGSSLVLQWSENPTVMPRWGAVITVRTGTLSQSFTVTQMGAHPALELSHSYWEAVPTADSFDVTVSVNGPLIWTAESSQPWLSVTSSGVPGATLTLSAEANTTAEVRSAAVRVALSANIYRTLLVTQEAPSRTLMLVAAIAEAERLLQYEWVFPWDLMLQEALNNAVRVLNNPNATQAQINSAAGGVWAAIEMLVPV